MLNFNEETQTVTFTFLYKGEEISKELSSSELINLKDEIEQYVTKAQQNISDKLLYHQMQKLIDKADKEVARWWEENQNKGKFYEDYENYQSYCYGKIWNTFWNLHKQISVDIDWCDPDTTYYADIMACYKAYQEIEWLMD